MSEQLTALEQTIVAGIITADSTLASYKSRNIRTCVRSDFSKTVGSSNKEHIMHRLDEVSKTGGDIFVLYGEKALSVPAGTRVLAFVLAQEKNRAPDAIIEVHDGTFKANNIPFGATIEINRLGEGFSGYIGVKAEVESKRLFGFIPEQYRRENGFRVETSGRVVFFSPIVDAMRTGSYGPWCNTEWVWDRQARPVAFTEGRICSVTDLGAWNYVIMWFYDHTSQKWLGWECDNNSGSVLWDLRNDPDQPDYVSSSPQDAKDFKVFQNVAMDDFMEFVSNTSRSKKEGAITPCEFAQEIQKRPYETARNCASFSAFPTPQNEWGWVYKTASGHQLIWLPGGTVYTRGLEKSVSFRAEVDGFFGVGSAVAEPKWLEPGLALGIAVQRPCIRDCDSEPEAASNEQFFTAIERKPFDVYNAQDLLAAIG